MKRLREMRDKYRAEMHDFKMAGHIESEVLAIGELLEAVS